MDTVQQVREAQSSAVWLQEKGLLREPDLDWILPLFLQNQLILMIFSSQV